MPPAVLRTVKVLRDSGRKRAVASAYT
jgi:hypothetical protein